MVELLTPVRVGRGIVISLATRPAWGEMAECVLTYWIPGEWILPAQTLGLAKGQEEVLVVKRHDLKWSAAGVESGYEARQSDFFESFVVCSQSCAWPVGVSEYEQQHYVVSHPVRLESAQRRIFSTLVRCELHRG